MIPPIPTSIDDPLPAPRRPLPGMPQDPPRQPVPPRGMDVPPFGEVHQAPPAAGPRSIPPMGASHPSMASRRPIPPMQTPPAAMDPYGQTPEPVPDEIPAFTDADLSEALLGLVGDPRSDQRCLTDPDFEAMLRSTVRRALSEHSTGPFDRPDLAHRCLWRFNALLTSRSYDDIVHRKMRRFRVEELLLFDREHTTLVSFASVKPARHASARKVSPFAHRVASELRDSSGELFPELRLDDGRRALVRSGQLADLVAVVQGEPDDLVKSDLDYALRRIEARFQAELEAGDPLLSEIQPLLEECLLIHSPVPPIGG